MLQMTFATNIYKVFETQTSQVYRFIAPQAPAALPMQNTEVAILGLKCGRCGANQKIQADLGKKQPLQAGHVPFPANNLPACSQCGAQQDLSDARREVEAGAKKKIVSW